MLANPKSPVLHSASAYRNHLKNKIKISQKRIRDKIDGNNSKIVHRIQAIKGASKTAAKKQHKQKICISSYYKD